MFSLKSWRNEKLVFLFIFYATNSQNRRRDKSTTSKLASLKEKPPLHYKNEQLLDDTNENTPSLYIGALGVTI